MTSVRGFLAALTAALFTSVLVTAPAALAAPPTEADANTLAIQGNYREALEAYARLYAESQHPTFLYNIARCHHRLGNPDEAISYYQLYLREERNVAEGKRNEIAGFIREMEAVKQARLKQSEEREKKRESAVAPAAPGQGLMPLQAPAGASPGPVIEARQASPSTETKSSSWVRTSGFVLGGVGLAAIGTGLFLAYDSVGAADEAKRRLVTASMMNRTDDYDTAKADFDAAKDRNALGWTVAAIGAAGVVGGVVMVLLSPDRKDGRSLALTPVMSARSAGLIAEGRW